MSLHSVVEQLSDTPGVTFNKLNPVLRANLVIAVEDLGDGGDLGEDIANIIISLSALCFAEGIHIDEEIRKANAHLHQLISE